MNRKLKWHSVRDKLPEPGKRVLCCDITPTRDTFSQEVLFTSALEPCDENNTKAAWAHYINEKCYTFREIISERTWSVSHWMPLIPIPSNNNLVKNNSDRFEILDL
jgi:hypothetical protein